MEPRIVTRAACTVVGLKCRTSMANNLIPALWDDFGRRMGEIRDTAADPACYGVCFYEEGDGPSGDYFSYLAGRAVTRAEELPTGMEARALPAGEYAVFEHRGALDTLQQTYGYIYKDWLPNSAYEMVGTQDFELYDYRFKHGQSDSVLEIWIPIQKK